VADLPLTVLDIALIAVLVVSGLFAFARGFVHEVLSVGGWVGAVLAAFFALPYARPYARPLVENELIADIAAGVAIFLVTLVILSFAKRSISRRVQDSALNALDRSLGFLFGVLRGAVLISLAYIAVEWMMPPADQPPWLRGARAMPLVEEGARLLKSVVPDETRAAAEESAGGARDDARKVLETQRMLRDIMTPEPKGGDAGGDAGSEGYGQKERREMERLIDSSR